MQDYFTGCRSPSQPRPYGASRAAKPVTFDQGALRVCATIGFPVTVVPAHTSVSSDDESRFERR